MLLHLISKADHTLHMLINLLIGNFRPDSPSAHDIASLGQGCHCLTNRHSGHLILFHQHIFCRKTVSLIIFSMLNICSQDCFHL